MFQLAGILAGLLSGSSHIPYLADIIKRKTKPERASWLIWSVLGSIAFFSQLAEGATQSLWFTAFDWLGVLLTFLLAIRYGVGGLSRRDIVALVGAGIGLVLWYLTSQAAAALLIVIFIDSTGTILTVLKAYEDPESETFVTWVGVTIAGILAIFAVGRFSPILLVYPFYIFLANLAVVVAMIAGRKRGSRPARQITNNHRTQGINK